MKHIITLVLLLITVNCRAQSGILSYTGVVKVNAYTADELYQHIKKWINGPYMSMQHTDIADEKEGNRIQINGNFRFYYNTLPFTCATGTIKYSIYIYVKDGRYKYEVTNFIHQGTLDNCSFGLMTTDKECPANTRPKEWGAVGANQVWDAVKADINHNVTELLTSLKADMAERGNANW